MESNCNEKSKPSRWAFYVRLSEKDYLRVLNMVAATRTSAQELFRKALLERMDLERPVYLLQPEQVGEFKTELRRQGNNINQIAKQMNTGLLSGWSQALAAVNVNYLKLMQILASNRANC